MSIKPILFSAPMVRALLDGRKTQTRRLLNPQPYHADSKPLGFFGITSYFVFGPPSCGSEVGQEHIKIPIAIGDRLYVREHWKACRQMDAIPPRDMSKGEPVFYIADGMVREQGCVMISTGKHRKAMHMPRWASRITLEVTDVRIERLQDISEEDAKAEGGRKMFQAGTNEEVYDVGGFGAFGDPRIAFMQLWDSLNAHRASWESNPWVAAYTFTVHKNNVDHAAKDGGGS